MTHSATSHERAERLAAVGQRPRASAPSRPASPWGLSPDMNSPVDCSRLAKGRARRPGAARKAGQRPRWTRG